MRLNGKRSWLPSWEPVEGWRPLLHFRALGLEAEVELIRIRLEEACQHLPFGGQLRLCGWRQRGERRYGQCGGLPDAGDLPGAGDEAVHQEGGQDLAVLRDDDRPVLVGDDAR